MKWRDEFAAGGSVALGKRLRLRSHLLEDRGDRIDLEKDFSLDEIPGGPSWSPLLRITGNGTSIEVDSSIDNYYPLALYLRSLRQRG